MADVPKTPGAEQIKKLFENRSVEEVTQLLPSELLEHIPIIGPPFRFLHNLIAEKHPTREEEDRQRSSDGATAEDAYPLDLSRFLLAPSDVFNNVPESC